MSEIPARTMHWRLRVADTAARWRFKRHARAALDPVRVRAHLGRPLWARELITPPVRRARTLVAGRAVELLMPPSGEASRVLLYVHGGGYIACSPATHRPITARIARLADAVVVVPDYRLAPEHPHPAGLDDVLATWEWLLARGVVPGQVGLVGDSAGGGLVVAALQQAPRRALPRPAAAVLFSPWVDLTVSGDSARENEERCALFRPAQLAAAARCYAPTERLADADVSPLFGAFDGLPPLCVHAGRDELLRDDATRLAERARAANVDVTLRTWPGVMHGWQFLGGWLPEADESLADAIAFLHRHVTPASSAAHALWATVVADATSRHGDDAPDEPSPEPRAPRA